MKKKPSVVQLLSLFMFVLFININSFPVFSDVKLNENPVETYALLFDQFPYEINGTTVCSAVEMSNSLLDLGWSMDNISIFLGDENMTETIILEQLNYLEQQVDENDLVFVYFTAHGHTYCRDILDFNDWFQLEYNQIGTKNKVFLMESCYGGEFARNFYEEGFAMSSVGEEELAIALFPGENGTWELTEPPFSGGISSHFWAKTLTNLAADTSLDGVVSLMEMYDYSLPDIRDCYNETFGVFPDVASYVKLIAGYTEYYPSPKVVNNLNYDLTLNATDFILNNDKYVIEEDLTKPAIYSVDVISYDEDDSVVEVFFDVSDQSDFDYYFYVNGTLERWGSHGATGLNSWSCKFTLTISSKVDYNVSLSVEDIWGNHNTNFTLVKYIGTTKTASFTLWVPIAVLIFSYCMVIFIRAKKRKD